MKAVDANVLARYFVDDPDDPQAAVQRPAALSTMRQRVFVCETVLLEFEWVLRGFYAFPRGQILRLLDALVGLPTVTLPDRPRVIDAINAYRSGMDFADALHLNAGRRCAAFATFDRRLAARARRLHDAVEVELLR